MPQKCTICSNKRIKEIDSALVRPGAVLRTIAHQYALSESALKRHVKGGHVAEKISKASHAHEAVAADDLLGELREAEKVTKEILAECRSDGNHKDALLALARREKQIELKGRVLGSFNDKLRIGGDKPIKIEWEVLAK